MIGALIGIIITLIIVGVSVVGGGTAPAADSAAGTVCANHPGADGRHSCVGGRVRDPHTARRDGCNASWLHMR